MTVRHYNLSSELCIILSPAFICLIFYLVCCWCLKLGNILCFAQALQSSKYEDWYWKFQVGKCYFRLGMFRWAREQTQIQVVAFDPEGEKRTSPFVQGRREDVQVRAEAAGDDRRLPASGQGESLRGHLFLPGFNLSRPYPMPFLLLNQVYVRLDQPMAALEVYRTGLDKFPNEVHNWRVTFFLNS